MPRVAWKRVRPISKKSTNRALDRALRSLAHPFAIASLLVLLVNDHILRRYWPSWWTGKLGDAAWLAFAPLILAATLAVLSPQSIRKRERQIGLLAFAATALLYALAKTIPFVHSIVIDTFSAVIGWEAEMRRDPTDLLALPGLLVGWYCWVQSVNPAPRNSSLGVILLALASLATIANQAVDPDEGITCLHVRDSRLIAASLERNYISSDGGQSWEESDEAITGVDAQDCGKWYVTSPTRQWQIEDTDDSSILYRFTTGERIERSEDSGETWNTEVEITPVTESQLHYYRRRNDRDSWVLFTQGPLDAVLDPTTGYVIVSMGHEGILLRTDTNETWQWVKVGPYERVDAVYIDLLLTNLYGEFWLGALLALLLAGAGAWFNGAIKRNTSYLLVLAAALWTIVTFWFPPALTFISGFMAIIPTSIGYMLLFIASMFGLLVALHSLNIIKRQKPSAFWVVTGLACLGTVSFWLPFVLWSQGAVPNYRTAREFALALALAALLGEVWYARHAHSEDGLSAME